jgi:hypothetical protein
MAEFLLVEQRIRYGLRSEIEDDAQVVATT